MARPRPVSGCRHPGPRRVFSSCRHQSRVRRNWIAFRRLPPLLEAPLSFEKSVNQPRAPSRSAHAPLVGFDAPLQRIQQKAPVSPGSSTLRHVPSLGTLTPSTASFALHLSGLVSSRSTLLGFARSPPSRSSLRRLETSLREFPGRSRTPLTRHPASTVPLSNASAALSCAGAHTGVPLQGLLPLHGSPDFSPGLPPTHFASLLSGCPDVHAAGASECSPRKDRDVLGLLRARSLPS